MSPDPRCRPTTPIHPRSDRGDHCLTGGSTQRLTSQPRVVDLFDDDCGSTVDPEDSRPVPAPPMCFDKRSLARYLDISVRSWDRATAMSLTPAPDLVVGNRSRWTPQTIEKWLRTHPRLPGRRGGGHDTP
jgi:hypothetical protein